MDRIKDHPRGSWLGIAGSACGSCHPLDQLSCDGEPRAPTSLYHRPMGKLASEMAQQKSANVSMSDDPQCFRLPPQDP